jgi:hypothetical protein
MPLKPNLRKKINDTKKERQLNINIDLAFNEFSKLPPEKVEPFNSFKSLKRFEEDQDNNGAIV